MAVRAVLFDVGGVIVRTEYQAPREHLAERLNMTYEDLVQLVFASESSRLASIGKITTEDHWKAVAARLSQSAVEIASIREEFFAGDVLDRGLVEFIGSLRPRFKTGLLSNAWPDAREYALRNHLDEVFDAMVYSSDVGIMKPERGIYEHALKQLDVPPAAAAFVDDTSINVEGAVKLGMHGIVFRNPQQMRTDLEALFR